MLKKVLPTKQKYFWAIASFCLLLFIASFVLQNYYLLLIPIALIAFTIAAYDVRIIYFLMIICSPFSMNPVENGGFSIDLPTEPCMLLITAIAPFLFILNASFYNKNFWKNPIVGMLVGAFLITFLASCFSTDIVLSFKFFLSKIWYVTSIFFIGSLLFYNDDAFVIKTLKPLLIISIVIVAWVTYKHWGLGFYFDKVTEASKPLFFNHVIYGSYVSQLTPLVLCVLLYQKIFSTKWWLLLGSFLLLLAALYFAYSRASWAAVFFAAFACIAIFKKKIQWFFLLFYLALFMGVVYMSTNKNYLAFAPDYKKSIMHDNLVDHLLSTLKGHDISSNERFYRWVAAGRMSVEKPLLGYGPNTFYDNYKKFTVSSFRTYVSRNPERSTTHNYYIYMMVEQGYIAMFWYAIFIVVIFIYGQKLYHRQQQKFYKYCVMAVLTMQAAIWVNNLFSELLEIDKIGIFFYAGLALLVAIDFKTSKTIISYHGSSPELVS